MNTHDKINVSIGILATLAMAGFAITPRVEPPPTPLEAMIQQERAFAKMADEKSTRDAFLEFLADESLLFMPGPTPGKMYYRSRPALPLKLSWAPEFADVSAAGDLGYTSGPWEIRKTATDPPSSFGHFNTLWRLQKDGSWKVEVDLGIAHEKPAVSVGDVKKVDSPTDNAPAPKEPKTIPDLQKELVDLDTAFNSRAEAAGIAKAYDEAATGAIRLFRSDNLPTIGKAAAVKLAQTSGTVGWRPALARASKSGDLGYSTGTMRLDQPTPAPTPSAVAPAPAPATPSATGAKLPAQSTPHYYVRIWRRDAAGRWKIVLEAVT
jgi:ketosteroid isomerase-like protein